MLQTLRRLLSYPSKPPSVAAGEPLNTVDSRDCGLVDAIRSGWFLNDTNELFRGFEIREEDVVLDVGCGGGGSTMFCARRGAHVIFTDVLEEKIAWVREQVRQTPAREALGIVSDSIPLPLPDATATKIIALEMLEHCEDPIEVMRELVRVGQPGALYLLTVPDPLCEHIQKELAPKQHFEHPNHIHIFERDEFTHLVTNAGLTIIQQDSSGFFWSMWMLIYWSQAKALGLKIETESHNVVKPPHPPLLDEWASLWRQLLDIPEAMPMKKALDKLLPKSQIIVARKP